jgi:K+-sensing histidine kinase KdpD
VSKARPAAACAGRGASIWGPRSESESGVPLGELRRLTQRLERQAEELAALRDVGRALSGSRDLDDVLRIILRAVTETLGFDMGAIALVDPQERLIRGVLGINQDEAVVKAIRCSLDSPDIRAHVIRSGKVEVVDGFDPRLDRETFEKYGHHNHATIFGPITVFGERIGVLSASRQRATHSPITPHEFTLFVLFLDHAGIALQNAKILESERKKTRRLWAVNEVGRRATASLELEPLLADTTQLVRDNFGYQRVAVMLVAPHDPTMLYRAAYSAASDEDWPDLRQPVGTGMIGWVAQTGETRLANDTTRDSHFVQAPGPHTGSELDVPLKVGQRIVGVLSIESEATGGFEPDDVPFLETLADQIAVAIQNSRLYQAAQRQTQQLGAINTVARRMSSLMTSQELLPFVVDLLRETFQCYSVSIFLRPSADDTATIVLAAAAGGKPGPMPPGTRLRLGQEGIVGWVAASGEALLANDVRREPRFLAYPGLPDTAAEVAVPIRSGERIAGVLDVQSERRDAFDDLDVATLQTLADQVGIALENSRLYEDSRRRSEQMTGLYEAGKAIAVSLDLEAILHAIILEVCGRLGFDRAGLALLDAPTGSLRSALASTSEGAVQPWPELCLAVPDDDAVMTAAAVSAWLARGRSAADHTGHSPLGPASQPAQGCDVATAPLQVRGRSIGVLLADNLVTGRPVEPEHVGILRTFANQASIAIDHARLYAEAAERATHLAQANRQLADLDRMKSQFVSMVSHELRTPLGLIKGYVGTLLRSDLHLDAESRSEFLTVIEEEADNLADLVGNLLDASRLEAGTLALDLQPTRLLPLIRKAVHDAGERAPDYRFQLDLPDDAPLINADGRRLEQVMRNLLDNAVKYSPAGSSITVSSAAVEGGVIVAVRDEGLGIAREHMDRIFDRFFRVDQTDNRRGGGSGLGLAIAKGIIEGHGGRIWVESAAGRGSTFKIFLPAAVPGD